MNEYYKEKRNDLLTQISIIDESKRALRRKTKALSDKNQKEIEQQVDEIENQSKKLFDLSDLYNKRVKDYTLLRMSFEYEKMKIMG